MNPFLLLLGLLGLSSLNFGQSKNAASAGATGKNADAVFIHSSIG